ncbi:AAA family ATPase, partial [Pseudomonas aeruginosa]|nr:ABC transporter ATP-binding protein [Pseudomonas aeruginosa]
GLDAGDPRMAGALSGALRQRLALACAVLHRPQVLFLDEPTSGVDPLSRHRFWALIRNLAAAGMTVVVTTHYLEEAAFCQRLGLMQRGRLIASGTLAALRAQADLAADAGVEAIFLAHLGRPA